MMVYVSRVALNEGLPAVSFIGVDVSFYDDEKTPPQMRGGICLPRQEGEDDHR